QESAKRSDPVHFRINLLQSFLKTLLRILEQVKLGHSPLLLFLQVFKGGLRVVPLAAEELSNLYKNLVDALRRLARLRVKPFQLLLTIPQFSKPPVGVLDLLGEAFNLFALRPSNVFL